MEDITLVLDTAKRAAYAAGEILREAHRADDVSITLKKDSSLVTQYDLKAEELIVDIIRSQFPHHDFLTEETHTTVTSREEFKKPVWVIDPIDGTTNFAYGNFQYAVSIGYIENHTAHVGVVYAPAVDELYHGIKGHGAFRNGHAITGSKTTELKYSIIACGYPSLKDGFDGELKRLGKLFEHCRDVRRFGAASLDICWIADGRQDAYYETVKPWDVAGGLVVAREAGVYVNHLYGVPNDAKYPADIYSEGVVVAAKGIGEQFFDLLKNNAAG